MNAALLTLAVILQDAENFADVLKKVRDCKSYGFSAKLEIEGLPQDIGEIPALAGTFDADKGLHYSVGDMGHVARRGSKIAIRETGGSWMTLEDALGDRQPQGAYALALEIVRMVRPLGELLKDADKAVPEAVRTADGDSAASWTGAFTEAAARKSVPFGARARKLEGAKISGTLSVRVADGKPCKLVTEHKIAGTKDGVDVEVTVRWTIELKDVDAAKSEMPDEARELIRE